MFSVIRKLREKAADEDLSNRDIWHDGLPPPEAD